MGLAKQVNRFNSAARCPIVLQFGQWRNNVVGSAGKVQGPPSAVAPELQAKIDKIIIFPLQ